MAGLESEEESGLPSDALSEEEHADHILVIDKEQDIETTFPTDRKNELSANVSGENDIDISGNAILRSEVSPIVIQIEMENQENVIVNELPASATDSEQMEPDVDTIVSETDDAYEETVNEKTDDQTQSEQRTLIENGQSSSTDKLLRLPLARIKNIIKMDPEVTLASQEAVATLAKAAELFIMTVSQDAIYKTLQSKRKTLLRKDLDHVFDTKECYAFLEGCMEL